MKRSLIAAIILTAGAAIAHAQQGQQTPMDEYGMPLGPNKAQELALYDLNHDGVIEDWERDKVNLRLLSEMDLNHDGVIDEKDRKLARERVKQMQAERAAEIKKYDKNGDGKLDEKENAERLADEARERAKQKPSQASVELSKPMINY